MNDPGPFSMDDFLMEDESANRRTDAKEGDDDGE